MPAEDRQGACAQPAGGAQAGPVQPGARHHRRAGRRQDDARQRHPADPAGQEGALPAVRPDRPGRQAAVRGDRRRGQDDPPPARSPTRPRAASRATRADPLGLRSAGRGRNLDGGRAADEPTCSGRCRPAASLLLVGDVDQLPSVGPGMVLRQPDRKRRRAGGAADRGLPPGGAQPDHHQRPPDQRRARCRRFRPRTPSRISIFIDRAEPEQIADTLVEMVKTPHTGQVPARSHPRHPGALPDEPGFAGHPRTERAAPGRTEPGPRRTSRSWRSSAGSSGHGTR